MVSNQVVRDGQKNSMTLSKGMGFTPSKADPCVWMREIKALKCYEYLAIYVDDLCIAAQNPGQIIQTLKIDYKLKVKGDGP